MSIEPETIAGQTITDVFSSWHEIAGTRSAQPVHVWLALSGLGTVKLHTLSGLVITRDDMYTPYDMGEHGRILVEKSGPAPLIERIGERVERVSRLHQSPLGISVGILLHFKDSSVGIADLGDELAVAVWPDDHWSRHNVSIAISG